MIHKCSVFGNTYISGNTNKEISVPIVVTPNLTSDHLQRYNRQFTVPNRETMELVWRRTQQPETSKWADVQSDQDRRRRMIHGLDTYNVIETGEGYAMAVTRPYVWFQTVSPFHETAQYTEQLHTALHNGGWVPKPGQTDRYSGTYNLGDIDITYRTKDRDIRDIVRGRHFPDDYNVLEVLLNNGKDKPPEQKDNIWGYVDSGIRKQDKRGKPELVEDMKKLSAFFPMQVELGCGPSIEAGIPALHYLHELYQVSEPEHGGRFIFGPNRDKFLNDFLQDPLNFYRKASVLYSNAIRAEPTKFYRLLNKLYNEGTIVGNIITNNFDGLCSQVGLKEHYVRRFEESAIVSKVDFHSNAKSLLVVGAHADRRRVQRQAREKGLKIIYVDPESFDEGHRKIEYPLESAQDGDMLLHNTAEQFAQEWERTYK